MLYNDLKDLTGNLSSTQESELRSDLGLPSVLNNLQGQIDNLTASIISLNSYYKYAVLSSDSLTEATTSFTVSVTVKAFSKVCSSVGSINGFLSNTNGISAVVNSPVGHAVINLSRSFEIDDDVITGDFEVTDGSFVNGDTVTINLTTLALNDVALIADELVLTVGA